MTGMGLSLTFFPMAEQVWQFAMKDSTSLVPLGQSRHCCTFVSYALCQGDQNEVVVGLFVSAQLVLPGFHLGIVMVHARRVVRGSENKPAGLLKSDSSKARKSAPNHELA